METPVQVVNPWFEELGRKSRPFYSVSSNPVCEYRGVKVYKFHESSWLYVLGDTAITERAGFTKGREREVIDGILDGTEPASDGVVSHLRASGFKGLTYGEYSIEYKAGRMA